MASDRYPRATWHPSKNHWKGNSGRKAVVIHIAQGGFSSSIKYMEDQGVSAHFMNSLSGTIAQMVGTDDSAWGNGLDWTDKGWMCPHDHIVRPTWQLIDTHYNPNVQTISIEHEGMSGNPWPQLQITATVDLLQWLGKKYPSLLPYRVGSTLIGHAHLDPRDKGFCPGNGIDLATLAARANTYIGVPIVVSNEPWVQIWASRGNTLPADQAAWAIPQLYKFHAAELGGCLAPEHYLVPGAVSVAVFERGLITYLAKTKKAYIGMRFPIDV